MKDKNYYTKIYEDRMTTLYDEYTNEDDPALCATEAFEETATAEEVVGYYLYNEANNALDKWLENTRGIDTDDKDDEVTRILRELFPMTAERCISILEDMECKLEWNCSAWGDEDEYECLNAIRYAIKALEERR